MRKHTGFFHPRTLVVHPDFEKLTDFVSSLPERFSRNEGRVIHKKRNELRVMEYNGASYVVKSYHSPNIFNRFVYGIFRPSKAKRAYEYAQLFLEIGVSTPQPVGYLNVRKGWLFDHSYFVSCMSDCPYLFKDLFYQKFDYAEQVVRTVGYVAALLHEHGCAHKDFGWENILFRRLAEGTIKVDIIDLNRLHIGTIGMKAGCKNFERLRATPQMHRWIAEEYAKVRGFDVNCCLKWIEFYRQARLSSHHE